MSKLVQCTACSGLKLAKDFSPDKRKANGLKSACRVCVAEAIWLKRNPGRELSERAVQPSKGRNTLLGAKVPGGASKSAKSLRKARAQAEVRQTPPVVRSELEQLLWEQQRDDTSRTKRERDELLIDPLVFDQWLAGQAVATRTGTRKGEPWEADQVEDVGRWMGWNEPSSAQRKWIETGWK